jgi:glycosyltransferase involved in cell wall biosynthesis
MAKNEVLLTDFPRIHSTEVTGKKIKKRIRESAGATANAAYETILNVVDTKSRINRINKLDMAWISREPIVGIPLWCGSLTIPYIYDIDDSIFLNPFSKKIVETLSRHSTVVFAGNDYLADYCSKFSSAVYVIPTAVDLSRYHPSKPTSTERPDSDEKFVVGWSGTSSSFEFFLPLLPSFLKFFQTRVGSVLRICADRLPLEFGELCKYIDFQLWTERDEVSQINSFDVGIMPMFDDDWSKGKCAYKMLLYMACGVPVCVSPYGVNQKLISHESVGLGCRTGQDWTEALDSMFRNRRNLRQDFNQGRGVVSKYYSVEIVGARILGLIRDFF